MSVAPPMTAQEQAEKVVVPGSVESTPLQLEDVFQFEWAADPRISPDGEEVVFLRTSMDIQKDRALRRLWMVPSAGGEAQPLSDGLNSESSPRWSPDGRKLAYVADREGSGAQIQLLWLDSGKTATLTQLEHSPGGLSWSADGSQLAFTMFVPKEVKPLAKMPKKPEGAQWAEPPIVIEELRYRADGRGYLEAGSTQVFVLPVEGGTPKRLTHDRFDYSSSLSWDPDGHSLIVSANRREDFELEPSDSELWRLYVSDGELIQLTSRYGPDQAPEVSPDGSFIAYKGFDDTRQGYTVTQLYIMPWDGSSWLSVTAELDRDVQSFAWNAAGNGLYYSYDDHGDTRLAFIDSDLQVHQMQRGLGGLSLGRPYSGSSFTISDNDRIAFTLGGTDHPADVAVGSEGDEPYLRLTRLNDDLFASRKLGKVEEFWTGSSFDQRSIQAWMVYPPGFDSEKKYPLLLEIHGGPFANYGSRFSLECQLYAAAGYVVVYANPRGSTSYGQEFGNLIHHAYPSQDYDDLMSCVDHVLARGFIDEDQLYVTGGSGGGVLTAWIVGKTERFRAAVVAKPVINWASFVLTADAYPSFVRNWFAAMPWEEPEVYWRRSPLSLVGNVTTPTMLLTGESDHRTPISESEQYYQALKLRSIPTALVRIPGASHGIASRPSRLAAKVAHVLAWFERHSGRD